MQGNDIGEYWYKGQGVVFEGVLASPPETLIAKLYKQRNNWEKYIGLFTPHEMPLKAMIDSSSRLGIATDVYTFTNPAAVEPINTWLLRKGISVSVMYYSSVEELSYDLQFQRSIRTIYVGTDEQAAVIGIRSHVVDKKKAWII
jgi:hypothetical protein